MTMPERVQKAFDFASDSTKQLITLSTGIVALTITFGKDVFQTTPFYAKVLLVIAWVIYLLSISFGILTLLSLTGVLEPDPDGNAVTAGTPPPPPPVGPAAPAAPTAPAAATAPEPSIRHGTITRFSGLQIWTFLLATFLIVIIGFATMRGNAGPAADDTSTSAASVSAAEQQVRDLQRKLVEGLTRRDAMLLDQIFADDCIFIGTLGQVINKAQIIGDVKSGALSYESIDTDDIAFHYYGTTVMETGHAVVKGRYKDQDVSGQFRYGAVYVQRAGKWQAVSFQIASVTQPANIQASTANTGGARPQGSGRSSRGGRPRGRRTGRPSARG
jgi:Domain of unknown function (DUF4440)